MKARLDMERFVIRFALKTLALALLCLFLVSSSWAQQNGFSQLEEDKSLILDQQITSGEEDAHIHEQKTPLKKKELLTRGEKTLLLNTGVMAANVVYGFLKWDYGESSFNFQNEGWFDRDTKYGGADKLGHFWSSYTLSHIFSYIYRKWGYNDGEANLYGVLSSLGLQIFNEVADGFSPSQGFSYEDTIMNILGCGAGYIWGKYPSLAKKIDFRMEYTPEFNSDDFGILTNYERQRFLVVAKADGFDFIKNPYLRYLEFHVGYSARGYDDYQVGGPDDRHRSIYIGLGFNLSKLLQKYVDTRVLDYIQIPYTSVSKDFPLD
jgi:hypothetical protein